MEKPTKTRKPYTSDLTDAQWELVQPLIPTWSVGRKRTTDMREVLNAIFYVLTSGCTWKNLPHDFPPEGTVRDYFHKWRRLGIWDNMHDTLREKVRVAAGREPTPSAGSIDSQSLKSARTADERGYDAGKKNQRNQAAYHG
jgi:putative transposase